MEQAKPAGTASEPCPFVWYELHTDDAVAAAAFYEPVLGWTTKDAGTPGKSYTLVSVRETPIAGLLQKPASAFASGQKASWLGYIGVPDVRLFSKRVQEAGGIVHRAAEEIPGVGTFAAVADPQGAVFILFEPPAGVKRPQQPPAATPGMPAWHDLGALSWEPDFDFYSGLFGWTKAQAIDMGPAGIYQIFAIGRQPAGGMMTLPDQTHGAGWLFYFHVAGIGAAIDRVKQNGGSVIHGPSEVPGGQQIAHCLDTQGAIFGIVGPGGK